MKRRIVLSLLFLSIEIGAVSKQTIRHSIQGDVLDGVKTYVSKHGINASVGHGDTLFEYAAKKGGLNILQYLTRNHTISERSYKKAAMAAAKAGREENVKFLIKKINTESSKKAVLMAAVKAPIENSDMIEMLLRDTDIKVTQSIVKAAETHNVSVGTVKLIKKYYREQTAKKK